MLYLRQFVSRLVDSVVRPLGSVKLILVVSFSGPSADACAEVDLTDRCADVTPPPDSFIKAASASSRGLCGRLQLRGVARETNSL